MPTILRIGASRVVIYPNDHRPAHVHVVGVGNHAVFNLQCPGGPPDLRENYGFSKVDLAVFVRRMQGIVGSLCTEWKAIHATYD